MAIIEGGNKVISVKTCLNTSLAIPPYQRPYKWKTKHVNQLVDDIIRHKNKKAYRLGTVVFHQEEESHTLNIVDGQQRLLTLTLLCKVLSKDCEISSSLLEHQFKSQVSIQNLKHNAALMQNRLSGYDGEERKALLDFVCDSCQVVVVTLDDLGEAFQFFDSQNSRGKALEPHDLLKAYHLRQLMESTQELERLNIVEDWEQAVSPNDDSPSLHHIIGNILFRLRRWLDGESGTYFTLHHLSTFKGMDLNDTPHPYAQPLQALHAFIQQYNTDPIRQWDKQYKTFPFQIDQLMMNGCGFFNFVQHYIGLYHTLFVASKPELAGLLEVVNNYKGSHRAGDRYVKTLFICAVLFYYDKFGDIELKKAAEVCFVWAYQLRLKQKRVLIQSIDSQALSADSLLQVIKKAALPHQVLNYTITPIENVTGISIEKVENKFKELKCYE